MTGSSYLCMDNNNYGNLHLGSRHTLNIAHCLTLWQIFGEVKDLVTSCIDGYNVTTITNANEKCVNAGHTFL